MFGGGHSRSRGSSLFDEDGDAAAAAAAVARADAGKQGGSLFATSGTNGAAPLADLIDDAGLFGDETLAHASAGVPAPAASAPLVTVAAQGGSSAPPEEVDDLAELRSMYQESKSLFESMGVGGGSGASDAAASTGTDGRGTVPKPSPAPDATGAGAPEPDTSAPQAPPPAGAAGATPSPPPPPPATQADGASAPPAAPSRTASAASSGRRWQTRQHNDLFDVNGDTTDVYAEQDGGAQPLGFVGMMPASQAELQALVASLRPRVTELETALKACQEELKAAKEENAHLRAENSKLRIRYHTRPGSEYDFSGLSGGASFRRGSGSTSPRSKRSSLIEGPGGSTLVSNDSHPLARRGGRPKSGMFLPADHEDSDEAAGGGGGAGDGSAEGRRRSRGSSGGGSAGGAQASALFSASQRASGAAGQQQALDPTWGAAAPSYLKSKDSMVGRRVVGATDGGKTPRRASEIAALFGTGSPAGAGGGGGKGGKAKGLFASVGEVAASRPGRSSSTASTGMPDGELFAAFMATPDAGQLKKAVSQFMKRTHVALDGGSSPTEIGASVTEFMEGAVNWLYDRDLFKAANDSTVDYARDQLERDIMVQLHPRVFEASREELAEDAALFRRCQCLQFLTASNLDVPASCNNDMVMRLAQDELSRINSHTTPQAKLDCIVACCDILFRSLNLTRGADASRPGADEFLPVFIYVVLRANVRQVLTNARYIERFRYPGGLMSKSGYCFANFQSALQFIQVLDHESVRGLDEATFKAKYAEIEAALNAKA